jgi:hypothetical protein
MLAAFSARSYVQFLSYAERFHILGALSLYPLMGSGGIICTVADRTHEYLSKVF